VLVFLLVVTLVLTVAIGVVTAWFVERLCARARLQGIKEAMNELSCGARLSFSRGEAPIPENIARCLDTMRTAVRSAKGPRQRGDAFAKNLRRLGQEIGSAAWQNGYEHGQLPATDEIRVDISLRDLLTIRWLAHAGFKLMMHNQAGEKFSFRDATDAQESNFAIDRLEWRLSKEHKDPTAPYALALGRQQMIWERWPESTALPELPHQSDPHDQNSHPQAA
jgi:hypothetical protein